MAFRPLLIIAGTFLISTPAFAKPPECKEPNAPSGCFHLVPIDVCDMAPIFDFETGRVTYPCGFKVMPRKTAAVAKALKLSPNTSALATKGSSVKISPEVRYKGSTVKDNGDGTSTIDHGGSAQETINTADKERVIKEYKDNQGIIISPR